MNAIAFEVKTSDGQVHQAPGGYWGLVYDARASKAGKVQEGAAQKVSDWPPTPAFETPPAPTEPPPPDRRSRADLSSPFA